MPLTVSMEVDEVRRCLTRGCCAGSSERERRRFRSLLTEEILVGMDDWETSAFGNCTADFAETVLLVTLGLAKSSETGWRGVSGELRRKGVDWKMACNLDRARAGSTAATVDMESVLCLTLSILGLQSSGRPRFFWEEAEVPGSLEVLRTTCDGVVLSLRGVEITTGVARESVLEGAISGGDGGALSVDGG
jgi:hypothetical protein